MYIKRNIIFGLIIISSSIIFAFIVAEIMIRRLGSFNQDGVFTINNQRLLPLKLPVERTRIILDELNSSNWEKAVYVYHPLIGWVNKENFTYERHGIVYHSTVDGIRSATSDSPPPSMDHNNLRIAIFGDSYTYSQDVNYKESWGNILEQNLKQKGINNEVLNFGLGGGNMGQAYLLWKEVGRKYKPDIIIFGFQPENRDRNFIIIDSLRSFDPGLPFSRPRFKLVNGKLQLFNSPTITPEQSLEVMKNIDEWEWAGSDISNYKDYFFLNSKLISLIYSRLQINKMIHKKIPEDLEDKNELAFEIIKQFKEETEKDGAKFVVVLLPMDEVAGIARENYNTLLDKLSKDMLVIRPKQIYEEAKKTPIKELFIPHYSIQANKLIGEDIAEALAKEMSLP